MKKLLLMFLLSAVCAISLSSKSNIGEIETKKFKPNRQSIQKCYFIQASGAGLHCMILNDDGSISVPYFKHNISTMDWWLQNDTLFVMSLKPCYTYDERELLRYMSDYCSSDSILEIIKSKSIVANQYKHLIGYYSILSLFKVVSNGDSITPILQSNIYPLNEDPEIKIRSISYSMLNFIREYCEKYGDFAIRYFYRDNGKSVLDWNAQKINKGNAYKIIDIQYKGDAVKNIMANSSNIDYIIANPMIYLDSVQMAGYDKYLLNKISGWLTSVKVGKKYKLKLFRPPYYECLPFSRFETSNIDSVYTMFGEAYGDWFAMPIE